jgi:hypothetical protein
MSNLKISIIILLSLAASRFIPHPPNFTSLLSLSFYIPVLFGIKFIPFLLVSFILTDFIIGFHKVVFFTWGSVILIGLLSKFFISSIIKRISGALLGACLFYLITNFGVWSLGSYGYTLEGLVTCYSLAIPFFAYSLISTFIFSGLIETILKLNIVKIFNLKRI